eukprot:scaffold2200_cov413-Prasinococcus_capsulatus_cf.AAC.31
MPQVSRLATASNVLPRATCSHRTIGRWSRVCSQLKRGSVGGGFGTGIPGARWPLRSHRPVEWREGGQRQTSRPSLVTYAAKQGKHAPPPRCLTSTCQRLPLTSRRKKLGLRPEFSLPRTSAALCR